MKEPRIFEKQLLRDYYLSAVAVLVYFIGGVVVAVLLIWRH